jgi:alpha-amylase/alpha-mannosidase (GH57 family)
MFYTETLKSTGLSDMTEYFFCWRNLQEFPIKTSSNKEVVNKTEEPKKEVVNKTEEPKKEVVKKTGPELMVGSYLVKSDKGVIHGMKVFSSSPGRAIVMLYNQDGKPLFNQNETAWVYDQEKAREWGGDNILVQGGDLEKRDYWLKIVKF